MTTDAEAVARLKRERNAVVLAHNYSLPEVQDVADFVGDSLGLSRRAAETDADVIVFCGVSFMAETAKILSPGKRVLLPEPDARCAMAAMCSPEQIRGARAASPGAQVVGYVNSTAAAKAEMDICCTSSNAVDVVSSLGGGDVIFVPDGNLGRYVESVLGGGRVRPWHGFCPVHQSISLRQIAELRAQHPGAPVLAHPECVPQVLAAADMVGSTENMISYVRGSPSREFVVATEVGMRHRLEAEFPGRRFHFPESAVCSAMKMADLRSIVACLTDMSGEVSLPDDVMRRALVPVRRMVEVK